MTEAAVEFACDCLAVEVLSDKYELGHAVAVVLVPVAHHIGVLLHEHHQILFGSGGIPLSGLGELLLDACLLEKVGHLGALLEVDDTFGADNVARPFFCEEIVELVEIEWIAAVVYECLYAVFLGLTLTVVVMMMVVMVVVMMMLGVL